MSASDRGKARSSAFLARFQGKITTVDPSGPGRGSRNGRLRENSSNSHSTSSQPAQSHDSRDGSHFHSGNEYDTNMNEAQNGEYHGDGTDLYAHQVPNSSLAQVQRTKPKLRDLDDMMLRQSMKQYSSNDKQPPVPPNNEKSKPFHGQEQPYHYQIPSSSPDGGYLPTPGERVRSRSELEPSRKGGGRRQPSQSNHYQQVDDPINQYYKNRPKQAPAKSRDTFLDAKIRAETKQDNSKQINEKHIHNDQDQLYFSRKSRPTNYKPRNLKQWKENKQEYVELGKLKPDLNTEKLIEKRANRDRVKEFSQNLHNINQRVCRRDAQANRPAKQVQKPMSTRDKAQEYAKKVPKPKVQRQLEPSVKQDAEELLVDGELGAEAELSALEELEIKHNAARREVDAIRNEMSKRGLQ